MHILVVSQYFWPETFRVNEIVSELSARGHEVTVLTGRPNYPEGEVFPAYAKDAAAFDRYGDADVVRIPLRPRGRGSLNLVRNYWSFVFWGCMLGPWKLRTRHFDAIFVFETSPITSALPAILLKWIKRTSLSMWVLDLWPETLAAVGVVRSPRVLHWVGRLCSFIYRHCDLILAPSLSFAAPIAKWSRAPEKFRYFPAWAEATFDDIENAACAPELQLHAGKFCILFAGNIGDAQDFPAILEAADLTRQRKDIHWLIVGDGRAAAQVHQDIAAQQLTDTVYMLGRFPLGRMPSFFAGSHALLVSLRDEPIFALTIPGKVQSYLSARKPILAMLNGEGARVVESAGAGLVCGAGDAQQLARNACRLADLPSSERQAMGLRGASYCIRHFSRSALMAQLEGWLNHRPGSAARPSR